MKASLVSVVAALVLSGQVFPLGLPLLCKQVQRGAPANCEQQMESQLSGPAFAAATHTAPCANPALCATSPTAVPALSGAVSVAARESQFVGFGVTTFAPADPQAPLPPPPQA